VFYTFILFLGSH